MFKRMSIWLQYVIAILVVIVVSTVAWLTGRDEVMPDWIEDYLVPGLSWIFVILVLIAIAHRIKKRLGDD